MDGLAKNIVSHFPAIQGEGRNGGKNVHFIRLFTTKCFENRPRCSFCDTVNKSIYKPTYSLNDLVSYLKLIEKEEKPLHYVITGGEPFNWPSIDLLELMNSIRLEYIAEDLKGNIKFDFETNGSYFTLERMKKDPILTWVFITSNIITISPKLSNSCAPGEDPFKSYDFAAMNEIQKLFPDKFDFKFVVDVDNEEEMIHGFEEVRRFQRLAGIRKENVWIMPKTPYHNQNNLKNLAELTINYKFNFSNRLHIQIWGSDVQEEK